jgi:hypothetical protein
MKRAFSHLENLDSLKKYLEDQGFHDIKMFSDTAFTICDGDLSVSSGDNKLRQVPSIILTNYANKNAVSAYNRLKKFKKTDKEVMKTFFNIDW